VYIAAIMPQRDQRRTPPIRTQSSCAVTHKSSKSPR
jgi:hypothetical protein